MSTWMQPFADKHITGQFGTRSAFRIRNGLGPHRGTDWARPNKTPIPAVTDGTIALVHYSKVIGWCIVQTGWAEGKTWYVGYAHLAKKPKLKKGDKIKMGQPIGLMGNTGSASSGPHLHATLSTTVKGIFWGKVFDLHKFINKHAGPGPEEDVEVELIPRNGNVIVQLDNFPVGNHLRLRKDGKSVWAKTVKEDRIHRKGVTLTGEHELCIEFNGKPFFCQKVKPEEVKPDRNPWAGRGNDKASTYGTRQAYEASKNQGSPLVEKEQPKPEEPKVIPEPPKVAAAKPRFYKVQSGDTLWGIAQKHNTTVAELVKTNNIKDPSKINVGQLIRIDN